MPHCFQIPREQLIGTFQPAFRRAREGQKSQTLQGGRGRANRSWEMRLQVSPCPAKETAWLGCFSHTPEKFDFHTIWSQRERPLSGESRVAPVITARHSSEGLCLDVIANALPRTSKPNTDSLAIAEHNAKLQREAWPSIRLV